jgi:hypothetical protein
MVENDVIAFGWDVTQTPDGTGKQTVYSVLRGPACVRTAGGGGAVPENRMTNRSPSRAALVRRVRSSAISGVMVRRGVLKVGPTGSMISSGRYGGDGGRQTMAGWRVNVIDGGRIAAMEERWGGGGDDDRFMFLGFVVRVLLVWLIWLCRASQSPRSYSVYPGGGCQIEGTSSPSLGTRQGSRISPCRPFASLACLACLACQACQACQA